MYESTRRVIEREYINISFTGEGEFNQGGKIEFDRVDLATEGIVLTEDKQDLTFMREGIYLLSFWITFQQINVSQPPRDYALIFKDQNNVIKASAGMVANRDDSLLYVSMKCSRIMKIEKGDILSLFNECESDIRLSSENGYSGELSIARVGNNLTTHAIGLISSQNLENLMPGDTIDFDTVEFSREIEYENGVIKIKENGIYIVSWTGTGVLEEFVPDQCNVGGIGFSIIRKGVQEITSGQLVGNDFCSSIILGEGILSLHDGDEIFLANTGSVGISIEDVNGTRAISLGLCRILSV